MADNNEIQKLKNQYPDLFKQFPEALLEFVLSEETASKVAEICTENGVEDEETIEKIAYRATLVLLEQVPKENFTTTLKRGAGLDINTAKKVSEQINNLIFSQAPGSKPGPPAPSSGKPSGGKPSWKKDTYREPIQ